MRNNVPWLHLQDAIDCLLLSFPLLSSPLLSSPLLRLNQCRYCGEYEEGDPSDHYRRAVQNHSPALSLHPPPQFIPWAPQDQVDQGLGPERLRRPAEGTVGPGGQRQCGQGTAKALEGAPWKAWCWVFVQWRWNWSPPPPPPLAGEEGLPGSCDAAWLQWEPLQRQSRPVRATF